jgi:hypothetical protein
LARPSYLHYGEELTLERRSGEEIIIQKPYQRGNLARAIEPILVGADLLT